MIPKLSLLTLELTQRCFQNCIFCSSNSSFSDNIQLSFDTVKRVITDFCFLGGKIAELSGGEPLSYDEIYRTIEYASDRGLQVHLFTCGHNTDKSIDFDRLEKVDRIYVNLQGPSKAIHDYLSQSPGSFDRTLKFIKECKSRGKWVGTHIIPLEPNIDEFDEYLKLAKMLKLDNISLLRFVEQGRGKNNILALNSDEILHLFSIIEKYRNGISFEFKVGCPLDFGFIYRRNKTAIACESGISRCVIRPNGNVIPCPAFKYSEEFLAGNVNTESLLEIWKTSQVFKQLRSFSHENLKGLCKNCPFLGICKGRCHAQRYRCYGDLHSSPDPYCPLRLTRNFEM